MFVQCDLIGLRPSEKPVCGLVPFGLVGQIDIQSVDKETTMLVGFQRNAERRRQLVLKRLELLLYERCLAVGLTANENPDCVGAERQADDKVKLIQIVPSRSLGGGPPVTGVLSDGA